MAGNMWFLFALVPLLAVATEPGSVGADQELVDDDECRADSASCALNALQRRQEVSSGDASRGPPAAKEATPESDKSNAEVPEDEELHLFLQNVSSLLFAQSSDEREAESDACPKDTGGSCRFMTCDGSRNSACAKVGCHKSSFFGVEHCYYKCTCMDGYCSRDGACVKQGGESMRGNGAVSNAEIERVKSSFGLSDTQVQLCVKEFQATDKDNKGYITADDLVADVQKRGKTANKAQMQSFINQYDLNKDGKLSFFEFGYMFSQTQKK